MVQNQQFTAVIANKYSHPAGLGQQAPADPDGVALLVA
jgi:hypothetical protein